MLFIPKKYANVNLSTNKLAIPKKGDLEYDSVIKIVEYNNNQIYLSSFASFLI